MPSVTNSAQISEPTRIRVLGRDLGGLVVVLTGMMAVMTVPYLSHRSAHITSRRSAPHELQDEMRLTSVTAVATAPLSRQSPCSPCEHGAQDADDNCQDADDEIYAVVD